MSAPPTVEHYRRYEVPRGNGQSLVDPPLSSATRAIAAARGRLLACELDIAGCKLGELTRSARESFANAALTYTRCYRDVSGELADRAAAPLDVPMLVSGHQAELYHPGVWFKNFVLDALARREAGLGIHLMIDTDVCRDATIRVPTGSAESPRLTTVAMDSNGPAIPFEDRLVGDRSVWDSFATRTTKAIAGMVGDPLVSRLWPQVTSQLEAVDGRLGWAVSRGRHLLESEWGNQTLEIPQSLICQLDEVRWLFCHLLYELPRLVACHNEALDRYRMAHRLRSPAQPMPDLSSDGDWLEAPLWVCHASNPVRRPLFVRHNRELLELTDRDGWHVQLSTSAADAVGQLAELERAGARIRTRALTTTLVARYLLGDLFLHGIGGAKYDEVTTDFATQFFGLAPSDYLAISATVQLPIDHDAAYPRDVIAMEQQLRDLRYHPERHLSGPHSSEVEAARATKQSWINTGKTFANAVERHEAIESANHTMFDKLQTKVAQLTADQQQLVQRVRATRILNGRDYSLCLYPEDFLHMQLKQLVQQELTG